MISQRIARETSWMALFVHVWETVCYWGSLHGAVERQQAAQAL